MTKTSKLILSELLWLIVTFIVTLLICRFVFFWDFSSGTLDLHWQDTYFVFTSMVVIAPLFLLMTFGLYFTKEIRKKFSRTIPNLILLTAGLLSVIMLAFVNKELIKLGTTSGDLTVYPPLSALPQAEEKEPGLNPFASFVTSVLTTLQVVITIALLYSTFHWGKGKKQSS